MNDPSKPYFINLDSLRFFAALGFFMHALTIKIDGVQYASWMEGVRNFAKNGALCVNVLHVLSGFLITFLLLKEEKDSGKFNVIRYYLRRALRIWPLYFLLLLLLFFVIPNIMQTLGYSYHETANPWAYILFWSNFYIINYGFPYSPVLAVLWTVSVEEQFYIVMPWLMRFFKKRRVQILVVIILISVAFRVYYRNDGFTMFFNTLTIMSDFAVGALIAWLAVNEHPVFFKWKAVPRKFGMIIYLAVFIMIIFYHPIFDSTIATIMERLVLGAGFGWVIFDQAFGEKKVFEMSRIPGFVWLGKRAYGIYCFHQFGILASIKILRTIHLIQSPVDYLLLLPILSFVLTIIMAALSYRFIERPFLNWKKKFGMKSEVQPL